MMVEATSTSKPSQWKEAPRTRVTGKAGGKGGSALQGDGIGQLADTIDLDSHMIPRL
jgi:hypothetical protein